MPLVNCPSCQRKLNAPDTAVGKQIRCPACKNVFRVPAPEPLVEPVIEMVEEPPPVARAVVRPPAPQPPDDYYDDRGERPGRRRGPEEDFDYEGSEGARVQARRVARGGASWLQLGALLNLLAYGVFAVLFFGLTAGQPGAGRAMNVALPVVVGMSVLYFVPMILVFVGASLLAALRAKGMVITACVFSFIMALQALGYGGMWTIVLLEALRYPAGGMIIFPLLIVLFSFLGMAFNIVGGIRGLLVLGKPAVRAAYYR